MSPNSGLLEVIGLDASALRLAAPALAVGNTRRDIRTSYWCSSPISPPELHRLPLGVPAGVPQRTMVGIPRPSRYPAAVRSAKNTHRRGGGDEMSAGSGRDG